MPVKSQTTINKTVNKKHLQARKKIFGINRDPEGCLLSRGREDGYEFFGDAIGRTKHVGREQHRHWKWLLRSLWYLKEMMCLRELLTGKSSKILPWRCKERRISKGGNHS